MSIVLFYHEIIKKNNYERSNLRYGKKENDPFRPNKTNTTLGRKSELASSTKDLRKKETGNREKYPVQNTSKILLWK